MSHPTPSQRAPRPLRPPLPAHIRTHIGQLRELADSFGIELILIFGSQAKGNARADSDFDIAVWLDEESAPPVRLRLVRDLQHIFRTDRVDVAILNRASALLQFQVARSGLPLVETRPGAYADFCVRSLQRHNDARDFYEAERVYLRRHFGLEPARDTAGEEAPHG